MAFPFARSPLWSGVHVASGPPGGGGQKAHGCGSSPSDGMTQKEQYWFVFILSWGNQGKQPRVAV